MMEGSGMTDPYVPPAGADTAPGSHPSVHTQPDQEQLPEFHTQPDHAEFQPDERPEFHTLPDYVETLPDERPELDLPPIGPPIDCFPQPTREELEMALHRAQLVMEDASAVLAPAIKAMEDGAWVSRKADEFSTGLTTHAQLAATTAERCVEVIQEALDAHGDDDVLEPRPL